MRLGYARVSTSDQNAELQSDALRAARCDKVFVDKGVAGVATPRPALDRCLKALRPGDVLVVWKLDRLGRSLAHLIETIEDLRARGVGFLSLSESLDTTSPQGMLIFNIMGALAQFERSLIAERTSAGRAAAVKRGVRFGRPFKLTLQQAKRARELRAGGTTIPEIAGLLGVHRGTIYRTLQRM